MTKVGRECLANGTRGIRFSDGILGCKISVVISWRPLVDAASFFTNCPLDIIEASFVGKFRIFSDNKVEILICNFESPELVGRPPLEPSEIVIPLFMLRGQQTSIISVDTFSRRVKDLWNGISCQNGSSFRFSDFIFLWSIAGFNSKTDTKLEVSWITFNSIAPNISPGLQRIKSYSFDSDCFRHCIQTDAARSKFQHFQRLDFGGTHQDFRFGFFLLDPSGCLVPYLDGERVIQTTPPAGVWCTGVLDEDQSTATTPTTFHTWLSMLRYAFAPRGQRAFCTSPVLAVHSNVSNSISFYSIRSDNSVKTLHFPCIEFTPPTSGSADYTYASRLNFHMFTGFEDVKSRSSRVSSQRVVVHLTNLSPVRLPNETALADYGKMLEAVARLATNLDCQVIRGPSAALETASASKKSSSIQSKPNGRSVKRSVKFHLPNSKNITPPFPHPSAMIGFEVPEASMLLEEGVVAVSAPAYSPYRYFPSPPPPFSPMPPPPPLPQYHHPQVSPACCHLQSNNNNASPVAHEEISRLEALIARLLAGQQPRQTPTTMMEKTTVGTNTSILREVCSVAVNTSAVWSTATDIGLMPATSLSSAPTPLPPTPCQTVESVGVQCEPVQKCLPQPQGACPFLGEVNQSLEFLPSPQSPLPQPPILHQSLESVLSLDAGFPDKPLTPLELPSHQNPCEENNIGDPGYSRLLAGIQQVLGSAPHMRKTVSVPKELSLVAVDAAATPPRLSSTSAAKATEWPSLTDADADSDEAQHRRRCEEVAARFDFSHSLLPLKTDVPSRGGPEKSTPRPGQSEASFPITHTSFTFASNLSPSSPPPPLRSYSRHNLKSTDESAIMMGLARKYLSPSIIAQLAPSTASTTVISPEVSCYGTDFSLATQRYLKEHGLLSTGGSEGTQVSEERCSWRGRPYHTEVSNIPRLTVMEVGEATGTQESYLPCSRVFSSIAGDMQAAEGTGEDLNFDAPVLDLEHLRALPKLL